MDSNIRTLTVKQVASALQFSVRAVYDQLRTSNLPGRKIAGKWRVLEDDLRAFILRATCDEQGKG